VTAIIMHVCDDCTAGNHRMCLDQGQARFSCDDGWEGACECEHDDLDGEPEATFTPAQSPEQMLREFHASKAIHAGLMPSAPTADIPGWVRDLRMRLLDEEVEELRAAVAAGDIVAIADALGDIEHVTRGTAVAYGIPSDAVFAEIFRSNMTKDNSPAEGKLVKGPGYEPPRIAEILGVKEG
jgi:predicted HAD superfamily Cof-like phosphohydrolase